MIEVRRQVIFIDFQDNEVVSRLASTSVEHFLVEVAHDQSFDRDFFSSGSTSINAAVILDRPDLLIAHAEQYKLLLENSLGTKFILVISGSNDSISDNPNRQIKLPSILDRDSVRLVWVSYPRGCIWRPGDSVATGIGISDGNSSPEFGEKAILDAFKIHEVFTEFFRRTEEQSFALLSVATRQSFFGKMSPSALADACRQAGELIAGNNLRSPLVPPSDPWKPPVLICGDYAGFKPLDPSGSLGQILAKTRDYSLGAEKALGIGRRSGWFSRCLALPKEHIEITTKLGEEYERCVKYSSEFFEEVSPEDGFNTLEYAALKKNGINVYPGKMENDPVNYINGALEPMTQSLRDGHSLSSLTQELKDSIGPIRPRAREESRKELEDAFDEPLLDKLKNAGGSYPHTLTRKFVRSVLKFSSSLVGKLSFTFTTILLVAAAVWSRNDGLVTGVALSIFGFAIIILIICAFAIAHIDRELSEWASKSGVEEVKTRVRNTVEVFNKIAINDWSLHGLRTETADMFDKFMEILGSSTEVIYTTLTGPAEKVEITKVQTDLRGNPVIRVDFNQGGDSGIYRNFPEVVSILRNDAMTLIDNTFKLYLNQLRGGKRKKEQVVDLISTQLEKTLCELVEMTMEDGIIVSVPRTMPGGGQLITEEGLKRRENLVDAIWEDEAIIRDIVIESVLTPSESSLMHFIHPKDLFTVDPTEGNQTELRFAPIPSQRPLVEQVSGNPLLSNVIFTEQTELAGIIRLIRFRIESYKFVDSNKS